MSEASTRLENIKKRLGEAAAFGFFGLLLAGPPVWAAWKFLTGGPLWQTKTVEVTRTTGTVPEVAPVLILWALVWVILGYMVVGPAPRRM